MRNAQLKPGYNVQIGGDSEYVAGAEIFQDRNDVWTLVPFTKHLEEKLGFSYPSVTADSGYESEEAYSYLAEKEITAFIKPQTYEQWKKRSFKKDIGKRENMGYTPESYGNIMSDQGILYRMNRSIQVEGAFGVLKNDTFY